MKYRDKFQNLNIINSCLFQLNLELRKNHLFVAKNAKKVVEAEKVTVDNIINNPNPAWTRPPADFINYKSFYKELYPMQFEEPLFNIHLNVDYPFNLTGILYFPKINNDLIFKKIEFNSIKIKYL